MQARGKASPISCIGGAAIDRSFRAVSPIQAGTSNPVALRHGFGGVARNVAENLARLGLQADLVSIVGDDAYGRDLRARLAELGVGTRHLMVEPSRATAEYVAVLEPDGRLALGLAHMDIFDVLPPSFIDAACSQIVHGGRVFADCNLPSVILLDLIARGRNGSIRLAIDAVSALKVLRLPEDLAGVDLLVLNLDEANALLGDADLSPRDIADALRARGAGRVVLTLAADGLVAADSDGVTTIPAVPASLVDVTGAGDALTAALLARLTAGATLADAARVGTLAAALTIEGQGSVRPDLSPALLEAAMSRVATHPRGHND